MDVSNIESGWLALLIAIFGGVGVKLTERFFDRGEKKLDEASDIRKELRDEVRELRAEMRRQREAMTEANEKYYKLQLENVELKRNVNNLLAENTELKRKYADVLKEVESLRKFVNKK